MNKNMLGWLRNNRNKPDVIVDFIFEEGLFYITVKNIGNKSACNITTKFSHHFNGVGGDKEISQLLMFKKIEFMPPGKEIKTFLDTSQSYFQREEPTNISTVIYFTDSTGKRFSNKINHNLDIYKEVGWITKPKSREVSNEKETDLPG